MHRRQFIAAGLGAAGVAATGVGLGGHLWPFLAREDLIPGAAPTIELPPQAWDVQADAVTFAVLGDNGSGGRQAVAVADRLARTYLERPFGLVVLLGDICYYGYIGDRFEQVFQRPLRPLIDAGVGFELAIGNHDGGLHHTDAGLEEIEAELALLGTPSRYYSTSHGPVDLFYLDSSEPGLLGSTSVDQVDWLDAALTESDNQWRVVALHHPPYSSGRHGSTHSTHDRLVPLLEHHRVDLVLAGHDHDYERTHPIGGITYVVSGGGCKRRSVGRSAFTAVSASILQFMVFDVVGDRLTGTCITPSGQVADHFEMRARRW